MLWQLAAVGHFLPYSGKDYDTGKMLVDQWYLDNLTPLHETFPKDRTSGAENVDPPNANSGGTKCNLVLLFMLLRSSDFCQYCEMTEGVGIVSTRTREKTSGMAAQADAWGEYLREVISHHLDISLACCSLKYYTKHAVASTTAVVEGSVCIYREIPRR